MPALGNGYESETKFEKAVKQKANAVLSNPRHQQVALDTYNSVTKDNAKDVQEFDFFGKPKNFGNREHARAIFKNVAENEFGSLSIFRKFKTGLNFNFDFSGGSSAKKTKPSIISTKNTYGLVAIGVEPNQDSMLMAAHSHDDFALVDHAPQAKVKWTIKKLTEESSAVLTDIHLENEVSRSFVDQFTSSKFKGNIAVDKDADPAKASALPDQIVSLNQENGFYSLQARTSGQFKVKEINHFMTFSFGKTLFQSIMTESLKNKQYSLLNWARWNSVIANTHFISDSRVIAHELTIYDGPVLYAVKAQTKTLDPTKIYDDANNLEFKLAVSF